MKYFCSFVAIVLAACVDAQEIQVSKVTLWVTPNMAKLKNPEMERLHNYSAAKTRHSLCSKQDIPCVRSRTFRVFEEGHSLCHEQDISCVPITKNALATF